MTDAILRIFIKNWPDTEDASVRMKCGRLTGVIGVVCNLFFFVSKLLIGLFSGSISVMADAFNNLSDVAASLISTLGFAAAALPPDEEHPFGHGRGEYIAGLGVAGLMLVVGFQFGKSSIEKILHPEPIVISRALFVVLIISVILKIWLSRFYTQVGTRIRSTPLIATGKDSRNDVLTTLVVIAGVITERVFHVYIDGWIGLIVALFILYSCMGTAMDTISPLLGESADPELVHRIAHRILHFDDRVMGIHDLMVHDYGPGRRFATVHMEIDAKEDVMEAHHLIDDIERAVSKEENIELLIHHDPVLTDDKEQNHLRLIVKKAIKEKDPRLSMHDFRLDRRKKEKRLSFDVVMPAKLKLDQDDVTNCIRERLEQDAPLFCDADYVLDITYDTTASFNRYLKDV